MPPPTSRIKIVTPPRGCQSKHIVPQPMWQQKNYSMRLDKVSLYKWIDRYIDIISKAMPTTHPV